MKGTVIALGQVEGRDAAALIEDGRLTDLLIDSDRPRPGAIYRARADRPMKGQGGMFLQTPDGAVFLRQVKGLSPGEPILVQVTGYAEPGKAVPVSSKLLFKSRYAIVTPEAPGLNISRQIRDDDIRDNLLVIAHEEMDGSDMGLILRSSCAGADPDAIAEDIRAMASLAEQVTADRTGAPEKLTEGDGPHDLAWRDWSPKATLADTPDAFEAHGVLDALEELQTPLAPLPGGASFYIEPTRALVAVDVNTGGDTSPAAGLKANLAAAKDLPRQLRLRGLGGQITLDLAPMGKKDRRQFETSLRAAFRHDATETALAGWTPLGHYELQRKRDRVPLSEVLS
ncbi:ribonuclease G [Roseovarius sp. HI0049]|nr:ribonuclease G [Roseovarius sp. HI0049]